jgi:hypothetical protein
MIALSELTEMARASSPIRFPEKQPIEPSKAQAKVGQS